MAANSPPVISLFGFVTIAFLCLAANIDRPAGPVQLAILSCLSRSANGLPPAVGYPVVCRPSIYPIFSIFAAGCAILP
jgi:hypothetical protein